MCPGLGVRRSNLRRDFVLGGLYVEMLAGAVKIPISTSHVQDAKAGKTYESQESRIVMRAYTLFFAVSLVNDGVSHNLAAMLHVLINIVESPQSIRRKAECFCEERTEVVREPLDLRKVLLKRLSKRRYEFLIWPL
jgi:hypothetical protein